MPIKERALSRLRDGDVVISYGRVEERNPLLREVVEMKHSLAFALVAFSCSVFAAEPIKVSSFGFAGEDSTRFLQAALDSDSPAILVDKMPTPWITSPLKGTSNKRIIFEDGVELVAKKGAFLSKNSCLLFFHNCSNVTMCGRATLRMQRDDYRKPPYAKSEHRHALNFYGCSNVVLEGLSIVGSGGDGIYIGQGSGPCRNIILRDIVCDRNHRQAISVISVDGLLIERCSFKNTSGTPPAAGIDFEPNRKSQCISNVMMRDSVFEGNAGCGIEFHLMHLDATSPRVSAVIENCRSVGNSGAAFKLACNSASPSGEVRGSIVCRGCELDGSAGSPFVLMKRKKDSIDLAFENCRWRESSVGNVRPLKEEDWKRKISSPVFIGGSAQILPVKTDLAAARIVDEKPGEMVEFSPVSTRYACNYVVYADRARTVRLRLRTDRVLPKFDYPSGSATVSRLNGGGDVARISLPGVKPEVISFDVPAPGFYRFRAPVGVGGVVELSGSDAPVALDADAKTSLFKPRCRLYFEVQEPEAAAAVIVMGGGANERVSAKLITSSGKEFWSSDEGVGAMHRIMLPKSRETGLWKVDLSRAAKGTFEDAAFMLVGIPGSRFPMREKRWTWMNDN